MNWTELGDHAEGSALLLAYMALLGIPHSAQWRVENQAAYASLRDRLAALVEADPQDIQDWCEQMVMGPMRLDYVAGDTMQ